MSDEQVLVQVFAYTTPDEKIFMYNITEEELQLTVEKFNRDIWFTMTDTEFAIFMSDDEEIHKNLKEDFIWFRPGVNKRSIMQCTCGAFLESGDDYGKLAKLA